MGVPRPVTTGREAPGQPPSVRGVFAARCAAAAAGVGYGVLLADVLAPEAMGQFAVAAAVAVIGAAVARCGLDAHLLRRAAERPESAAGLATRCLAVAGLAGVLVAVGCAVAGRLLRPDAAGTFAAMQVAVPFLAMGHVLGGLLKAGDRPAAAVFLETGGWQAVLCACAVGMALAGGGSLAVVALAFAAGSALVLAAFLAAARRRPDAPPLFGRGRLREAPRIPWREAAPLAAVSVGNVLVRWTDALWLAWWHDAGTVAVYVVCTRLAGGIGFVGHAVGAVAAPRFARRHGRRDADGLRTEFRRALATSAVWGAVGAAGLAAAGPVALRFLGASYANASTVLQVAAVLMAVQVALSPVRHLAAMSGRAADHARPLAAMLVLQQAAYLALVPSFGQAGALAGFAVPQALAHLVTLGSLRRRAEFGWLARGR